MAKAKRKTKSDKKSKSSLQNNISRLWTSSQKDLKKVSKEGTNLVKKGENAFKEFSKKHKKDFERISSETSRLLKQGEITLRKASKQGRKTINSINASLRKEQLYHRLGKAIYKVPKLKWKSDKQVIGIIKEIDQINKAS